MRRTPAPHSRQTAIHLNRNPSSNPNQRRENERGNKLNTWEERFGAWTVIARPSLSSFSITLYVDLCTFWIPLHFKTPLISPVSTLFTMLFLCRPVYICGSRPFADTPFSFTLVFASFAPLRYLVCYTCVNRLMWKTILFKYGRVASVLL